jgi:imidazoleglycerol phosphate synthase glutamine amidotransferase subunit HisH
VKLAIVDLGYGNVGSIAVAFERCGLWAEVTVDPQEFGAGG